MRISVVVPAFNNARYLPLAVASVRAQTQPVTEIIIVDDGSEDDTTAVVAALGSEIQYIKQHNQGPSAARNLGVSKASGDVIAFLDADDEWTETAVERQKAVFEKFPDLSLVTGDMAAVNETGQLVAKSWFAQHGIADKVRAWGSNPVPNAVAEIVRCNFVGTSVAMVRRSVFQATGGFRADLRYGEDLELWARIAAEHGVVCLPDVLGLRRSHARNTTKSLEPMLRDLVRMSEIIDAWGSETLMQQGLDPDFMVATAMADLGYWLFSNDRQAEARRVLWAAARKQLSARVGRSLLLSCLPRGLMHSLRRTRDRLGA